jgi:hypothetical protein
MAFVDRDGSNKIKAVFARQQRANQEEVADDAPDVVSFFNPPALTIDELAGARFDGMDKATKAALLLMRSYCNALQAGTYTNKSLAQLKADYITAFKAIP